MKKLSSKKLRSLNDPKFQTLENELLKAVVGGDGDTTLTSIRTYDGSCQCFTWDSVLLDDSGSTGTIWT